MPRVGKVDYTAMSLAVADSQLSLLLQYIAMVVVPAPAPCVNGWRLAKSLGVRHADPRKISNFLAAFWPKIEHS